MIIRYDINLGLYYSLWNDLAADVSLQIDVREKIIDRSAKADAHVTSLPYHMPL